MSESQAALTVRGVRKTFEAENAPVRALRGVDLTVSEGDFVALMGPSGCGKSTLLNLVAGLDTADEGEISVAGEQVTGRSEDDLARLRRRGPAYGARCRRFGAGPAGDHPPGWAGGRRGGGAPGLEPGGGAHGGGGNPGARRAPSPG